MSEVEMQGMRAGVPERFAGILPYQRATESLRREVFRDHWDGISRSRLAARQGIGSATVERWFQHGLRRLAAERSSAACPRVLGIDEHFFTRRKGYATTFCNLEKHSVYDVVLGRSEASLASYLKGLNLKRSSESAWRATFQGVSDGAAAEKAADPEGMRAAGARFLQAIEALKSSGFAPLVRLGETLKSWVEELASMWRFTRNNGITEGFQTKMEVLQRQAYGFRNFSNYRLRVRVMCC